MVIHYNFDNSNITTLNATLFGIQGVDTDAHPVFVDPTYYRCIGHDGTNALIAKGTTAGGGASFDAVVAATFTSALSGADSVADITTAIAAAPVL